MFLLGPNGGLELVLDAQQYEYMYYYYKDNLGAGMYKREELTTVCDLALILFGETLF